MKREGVKTGVRKERVHQRFKRYKKKRDERGGTTQKDGRKERKRPTG